MVNKIIIVVVFFGSYKCFAQQDTVSVSYFKDYNDRITASLYYLDASNSFGFIYNSDDGQENFLSLSPNRREIIGFNLSYEFIDISYGYSPKFLSENKDNEGSKSFNLGTRFYYKKWMQSLNFINQTGFYVSDGDIEASFPRLRTTKIGGTTSYIFNDKFSYKTIVNQKEWQTKSAGSFIPNLTVYYTNFDLNSGEPGEESNVFLASLSPSYFYNLVINNRVLVSGGLALGGGISSVDGDVSGLVELDLNFKIGYNVDSFFTFFSFNYADFLQDSSTAIQLQDEISTARITAGYRFKAPKKVKDIYDKTTKKIGL